ncbi:MAG: CAP domain-containing protein, partial [Paracoccus sp. (in: a-proteobacteria)]|nr:CAP domain-containing protein [Paracoccus sp. (in: a-proteobacteria)]
VQDPAAIAQMEAEAIPQRVLQQINLLRANISLQPLALNPQLSAAAMAHSRDMSAQNRAWHWGSDGSSPLDRARSQGYSGSILGENISESFENDMQTLSAWMGVRETRDVIMDPSATQLGLAWYQEPSGKIWWTLLTGT